MQIVFISISFIEAANLKKLLEKFFDLLVQIRMEHVSVLIKHEGYTEKETASWVGYTNVYYFTSCYKKYMEHANND